MSKERDLATKAANSILHRVTKKVASRWREVILPLCSALVRHVERCVPCWAALYKRDIDILD